MVQRLVVSTLEITESSAESKMIREINEYMYSVYTDLIHIIYTVSYTHLTLPTIYSV